MEVVKFSIGEKIQRWGEKIKLQKDLRMLFSE
jgi:hypothetical protein